MGGGGGGGQSLSYHSPLLCILPLLPLPIPIIPPQVEELQDALARKRQAVMDKEAALAYQTAGFQHGRKGW